MVINEYCKNCQLRRNLKKYPATASADEIAAYQRGVRSIIAHSDGLSTPQTSEKMIALRRELFGPAKDFTTIKRHFNSLMLNLLPHMQQQVAEADDALRLAVQFSMVGNYIDFGVLEEVDDQELRSKLDAAKDIAIAPEMLDSFRREVEKAHRLVLFTDNCGEIVTDKLLLSVLRNIGMPGNVIGAISSEAMDEIRKADVLVSKGQGNYEGLSGCGLNIFYLFLCKCEAFIQRFNVPQFTGVMTREVCQDNAGGV